MSVPFYVPFSGQNGTNGTARHLARAIRETALCRAVSRAVSTVPFCAVSSLEEA